MLLGLLPDVWQWASSVPSGREWADALGKQCGAGGAQVIALDMGVDRQRQRRIVRVALIFLALFVSCLLAWKAIGWLRNPTKTVVRPRPQPTVLTADGEHMTEPYVPEAKPFVPQGFGRALGDRSSLSHMTDMAGFSEREEEEFPLIYGPRKVRKAIEGRRKAREQAKKQSN
jgi:hypothetical protein